MGATLHDTHEDVRRTMEAIEARRVYEAAERAEISTNWRRLRLYREALQEEIARLRQDMLEEDPKRLLATARKSGESASDAAACHAHARAELSAHESAATLVSRLLPAWNRRRAELDAAVSGTAERVTTAESREGVLRRWAEATARSNRDANRASGGVSGAAEARLAAVDLAMRQIRTGDAPLLDCLRRWDVEALLRVADIKARLDLYGRVGERDWTFYLSSGHTILVEDSARLEPDSGPVSDEGSVVRVSAMEDGRTAGTTLRAYGGVAAGADLAHLDVVTLAEMLGRLRMDRLDIDADLLEAYLTSTTPDWRDAVEDELDRRDRATPAPVATSAESPYDVLGVTESMSSSDVADAFRAQVQAVQNLPNGAPYRRLVEAFKALKALRAEQKTEGDGGWLEVPL